MSYPDDFPGFRRFVYYLIILIASAVTCGQILALRRPTLGDNDRSRWDTIRALVDDGTYAIGRRDPTLATKENPHGDVGIIAEDDWKTIDKVLRPDNQTFYSSKPPLLPSMLAGEYWLLKRVCGWSLTDSSGAVVRSMLLTVNWVPFILYLIVLARLLERYAETNWARVIVLAGGAFGTFLAPFAVTLNNHSIATCSALFALYPALRLWQSPDRDDGEGLSAIKVAAYALLAGFFAGFAACNELPATVFALALFILLLVRRPRCALAYFAPAAVFPVAAFFLTNYLAIGQLSPAYSELDSPWYQYSGSFWNKAEGVKEGIDWAHESKWVYGFHLLLGHHGLFLLTPLFLLGAAGIVVLTIRALITMRQSMPADAQEAPADSMLVRLRALPSITMAGLLGVVTVPTVIAFYVAKTNNYGGWTVAPRWLIWLTPLFLVTMIPIADWLALRKSGRILGYILLALSVASASYSPGNPWRHPWFYDFLSHQGLIKY
jgi:hypothetical protein